MGQKSKFQKLMLGAVCTLFCGLCLAAEASAQTLPDGKGKAEFIHNCTACHRADMVTRVKKTPSEWRQSVDDMAARGTDGTKEDLDNVVLYLDTYFSTDKPASPEPATPSSTTSDPSTPAGPQALNASETEHLQRVLAENHCLTCRRIEQQSSYSRPTLNGTGTRRTTDEIQTAIITPRLRPFTTTTNPMPSCEGKITGGDLDDLVRYLASLPPVDDRAHK